MFKRVVVYDMKVVVVEVGSGGYIWGNNLEISRCISIGDRVTGRE